MNTGGRNVMAVWFFTKKEKTLVAMVSPFNIEV
jgi:hypothetical protein